jgi:serine/threonine protein kinase
MLTALEWDKTLPRRELLPGHTDTQLQVTSRGGTTYGQLVLGNRSLDYCHSVEHCGYAVIHRDIRPANSEADTGLCHFFL